MKKASLALTFGFVLFTFFIFRHSRGDDLSSVYLAARLMASEHGDHLYDHHPRRFNVVRTPAWETAKQESGFSGFMHPYVYPPLWAAAVTPLAKHLSFRHFNRIFLLVNIASFAAAILLAAKMWAPRFLRPSYLATTLLFLTLTSPFSMALFLNQIHLLIIFLIVGAIYCAQKRIYWAAGLLLAVPAAIKITPVLLAVYWLFTGKRKAVVFFSAGLLVFLGFSLLLIEPGLNQAYLATLKRASNVLLVSFNNQSLAAFLGGFETAPSERFGWRIMPLPLLYKLLSYGTLGAVFVYLAYVALRNRSMDRQTDFLASLSVILVTTVCAPIAWDHYYVLLVFPIMVLLERCHDKPHAWIWMVVAAVVALNLFPVALNRRNPQIMEAVTLVRSHFYSGVLMLTTLLIVLWPHKRAGGDESPKTERIRPTGNSTGSPMPGDLGFSLTELLVAVAVILIIMALLLPGFAGLKERGREIQCRSNLRQMGVAMNHYVGEIGVGNRLPH